MPGGSTTKLCNSCMQRINVACKKCKLCGAQQPMKRKLQKAKEKINQEWGQKLKKGGNTNKLVDSAQILIHKFKMVGLNPIILFGYAKKNTIVCDCLNGLELVTDKEKGAIQAIRDQYGDLLKEMIERQREAQSSSTEAPEGQRDPAENSANLEAMKDDENLSVSKLSCGRGQSAADLECNPSLLHRVHRRFEPNLSDSAAAISHRHVALSHVSPRLHAPFGTYM
ncbi:uncharacterized protein LOC134099229 [Sardina pilchardus]|uniref:uncharacterized protein LOC134099229 n=1 Tax=Sardina pilchardus TaxID=27697 RepID=UPI002E146C3E